jgi:(S)-mandelate dehydrogenase
MTSIKRIYSIEDLRLASKKRLPKGVFEYIDRGTEDEVALAGNRAAFERLHLNPRFMVGLDERDMGTEIFGKRTELPIGIAPTAVAGLMWYQGELALAKAAAAKGIPFTLATGSLTSMETIAEAGGRLWFQLYMWDEPELSYDLVRRAKRLGFETLVVTVDSALGRLREHNERNGFTFPFKPNARALASMTMKPGWLFRVLFKTILTSGMPKNVNYPEHYQPMVTIRGTPKPRFNKGMTWEDVARLKELWDGPMIVKSIMTPHDARLAVEHGADAVVVSNHGGRAMDSALATIEALPAVVDEVGTETKIILDSGIRRGSDIVKSLALGADMVLIGRATLYGTATGGQTGAEKAIDILGTEFEKTMGSAGCRTVNEVTRDLLAYPPF